MTLDFTTGSSRNRPIRTTLSRFLTSPLRGLMEISEGIRPAEVFYGYKYLPVKAVDVELEDGVVIPKGTIVSTLSQLDVVAIGSPEHFPPTASGGIYSGIGKLTGTAMSENIDTSWYGYDQSVAGLLTICNGGLAVLGSNALELYSTRDVTVGTINSNGTLAAASDSSDGRRANMPVGVVPADVYQHIDGKFVNYKQMDKSGILCDWYIEVPYIFDTSGNVYDDGTKAAYNAISLQHAYLWSNTKADIRTGSLVCSDRFGKFYCQYPSTATMGAQQYPANRAGDAALANGAGSALERLIPSGIAAVAAYKTVQTVGRIVAIDNRWPKDMLQYVDTYPESAMPGTETGGLPSHLYNFVLDYLTTRDGSVPSIATILTFVTAIADGTRAFATSGAGVVRIQLEIGG